MTKSDPELYQQHRVMISELQDLVSRLSKFSSDALEVPAAACRHDGPATTIASLGVQAAEASFRGAAILTELFARLSKTEHQLTIQTIHRGTNES